MLAKTLRLTGKDINFLTKKKQYISAGYFSFFYFKQYSNLSHHQISCHISLKLSKKSIIRHLVKRAIMSWVQQQNIVYVPIKNTYYKFFVIINKRVLEDVQKEIEKSEKKAIIARVQCEFEKAWKIVIRKLAS